MHLPAAKTPTHEVIYQRIRDMILFGELAPGQAVTIQGLAELVGAGMTPVREAIRRLTAEQALAFQGNRRVSVPELTAGQLDELSFARQAIEPELALRAAGRLSRADVERIKAIDDHLNQAIAQGDVHGYLTHNYRFHFALYERSDAGILLSIVTSLWLRAGPSLRVVCGRYGTANLPDNHELAIKAMRAGDPKAVARAIARDIGQGTELVRRAQTLE